MTPSRPLSHQIDARSGPLRFATPARLGVIAVSVMAVLALGIVLVPRGERPPIVGASPSATASDAPATTPPEPSATPTPSRTTAPTPQPTSAPPAFWTELTWSDPVTPSSVIHLYDLVPWGDGYVAGGTVGEGSTRAAFLTSPDGLEWTLVSQSAGAGDPGMTRWPRHLIELDGQLLAFSHAAAGARDAADRVPVVWHATSADGSTWSRIETSGWDDAWRQAAATLPNTWILEQHPIETGLVDVASGPARMVAIGNSYAADGNSVVPVILHSTDGRSWSPTALAAGSDDALLNSIVEHHGRFVITGAVGVGPEPSDAMAAAWYSEDGLTWTRATIEPDEAGLSAGSELGPLWAADDGLVACRGNREMAAGGWRYMDGWLSTDGKGWRHSPQPGPHPACDWSASDGTRIVLLGPRDHASPVSWPGVTVASVSTDGVAWQPLELSTTLTDRLERFWVVPDGVIYAGERSFWFGMAVED